MRLSQKSSVAFPLRNVQNCCWYMIDMCVEREEKVKDGNLFEVPLTDDEAGWLALFKAKMLHNGLLLAARRLL